MSVTVMTGGSTESEEVGSGLLMLEGSVWLVPEGTVSLVLEGTSFVFDETTVEIPVGWVG